MRAFLARDNNLLLLLLEHDASDVCHSVCPSVCSPPAKTQTVVVTSAVTVNAAKTVCPQGGCGPVTVTVTQTAAAPVATQVLTQNVVDTITSVIALPAPTQTISTTAQVTITSQPIVTVTSTIPLPNNGLAKRSATPQVPDWLKSYVLPVVCDACTDIFRPPPASTVTVTQKSAATVTNVQTITQSVSTVIVTATVTPIVSTFQTAVLVTSTQTSTVTSQPPAVTSIVTVAIATTTTDVATPSTSTVTVCPSQTSNVWSVDNSVQQGLTYWEVGLDLGGCCTYCFNTPGCNAWWWTGPDTPSITYGPDGPPWCYIFVDGAPNSGPDSTACPKGLGSATFELLGRPVAIGGPGQCWSGPSS